MTTVSLTMVDTDEEAELTEKYSVRKVPHVLFNDKVVLTAQMAAELLSEEIGGFTAAVEQSATFGTFEMQGGLDSLNNGLQKASSNPAMESLSFDSSSGGGGIMVGQSAVFNHLFNSLIESSVEASEGELGRWQKFNMLAISQKIMTPEAVQTLTRASLGDYVHIGVLQSVVTSILAINPASRQYLYQVGENMGRYSNVQYRFLSANRRVMEDTDHEKKFSDILEGLQELYSANSLGLPLYLVSRSLLISSSNKTALLQVYDSAYSAQMGPIAQPVCYLIAGEIAGLIQTTLAEEKVAVTETKCWGLGDPYCQFDIELGKSRDFSLEKTRWFLTEAEKKRFQNSLNIISRNMYINI